MRHVPGITASVVLLFLLTTPARAEEQWSAEQQAVLEAIGQLSASTAPGGGGADAYASLLHEGFSRWTVGSHVVNDKAAWVDGVRGWFDDGWRVSDRETEIIEIQIKGDFALTRRIVEETYLGPNEETSTSRAAIAEVWTRGSSGWLLFRVNAHPMPNP